MDWQPIETAPKDGTPFLANCGGIVEKIAWFDGWNDGVATKPSGPTWGIAMSDGDRIEDEGWDTGTGRYLTPNDAPTEWQPLPNPPHPPKL